MQDDVERVARALCKAHYGLGETKLCVAYLEEHWPLWIPQARAIIPLVLEEAAKVVERGPFVGPDAVAHAIQHAAAIRAIGAKP
jgi:hypothetical protein